ncbi:MAG TPA: hypothetical protein VGN20_24550 [Mucilaginibacter sp.]|jgi:hypothetical protein
MTKLYRAISQAEKEDYDQIRLFRTTRNTLEAKQFFKSLAAVRQFVERSVLQTYNPPYLYLLTVTVDNSLLHEANPDNMSLDGFEAMNIAEDDLIAFNNCVTFVEEEEL